MSGKKNLLIVLLMIVLLGVVAGGLVWNATHYTMIDFKFYPRDAAVLDLRDQALTVSQYERFVRQLPDCQIRWNIPFQGQTYPDTTDTVTITSLSESDIRILGYFPSLKTVEAEGCTDYAALQLLCQTLPEVTVRYSIPLGGTAYPSGADTVLLTGVTQEEVSLLKYLPNLRSVALAGGDCLDGADDLQKYCQKNTISFHLQFGSETVPTSAAELTISGATEGDLSLLSLLPELKKLQLHDPAASAQTVTGLSKAYPKLSVSWNKTVWGATVENGVEELDLSAATPTTLEEVEAACAYFPTLKEVFLGRCDQLDYEKIADYRERSRSQYKVVWTVNFRDKMFVRSDEKSFFPCHPNNGRLCNFNDTDAKNLKYLEEVEAIDVGHMPLTDSSWLKYMPKLKYLILSWTGVTNLDGIENCKELIFLECTDGPLKSIEGIQECTALEDVNLSATPADITPLLDMPWLNSVYLIYCRGGDAYKVSQALPDTRVCASGDATVGGGWRRLPNYYAMRDALGAYYMD